MQTPRAARLLESSLLIAFFVHGLAMVSMVLFLLPGMPGGTAASDFIRIKYVAAHAWTWRFGWLFWQATAVADLLLSIALLLTPWIKKPIALLALLATIAGFIPDQYNQFRWTWTGPWLAAVSASRGTWQNYLRFEATVFHGIAAWGTVGYLLAAIGWTWCFADAGVWSKNLTRLSIATWSIFAAATAVLFFPVHLVNQLSPVVSVANAIAFVLLMIWLAAVTEKVLRRSRPETDFGGLALWRSPRRRWYAPAIDTLANSRFVRAIFEYIPPSAMASDITDVVYINYLLPADRLMSLVPAPLQLQLVGQQQAILSLLFFRHGHFGPVDFVRRLWPSPLQSNLRVYVIDPATDTTGIHFVTTAITSTPHALATRLLCDGVPMHVPAAADLRRVGDTLTLRQSPGPGTAMDFSADLTPTKSHEIPAEWSSAFSSYPELLRRIVPQDRALDSQPWYGQLSRQEIDLQIPLEECQPLAGEVQSIYLSRWVAGVKPVCFLVPKVGFQFAAQQYDTTEPL